jgi:transposase InsO family protein
MRRAHPGWGPRRITFELDRAGFSPLPSESAVYRALGRLGLIDPGARRPRDRRWRRWERGDPMELWQMETVGGFVLADGTRAKALTGVDDHSRFCVSAFLMLRESSRRVCEGLALAMRTYGVPVEILTDNGKVFTGWFNRPAVEVLFDRVCRENGLTHRLTQPRSPTTTGKVERFHAVCVRSSAPTVSSRTWALLRPSSTSGSSTTTPCGLIRGSVWRSRRSASAWRSSHRLRTAWSPVVRWWCRLMSVGGSSG